jgi:hypothetical protein
VARITGVDAEGRGCPTLCSVCDSTILCLFRAGDTAEADSRFNLRLSEGQGSEGRQVGRLVFVTLGAT